MSPTTIDLASRPVKKSCDNSNSSCNSNGITGNALFAGLRNFPNAPSAFEDSEGLISGFITSIGFTLPAINAVVGNFASRISVSPVLYPSTNTNAPLGTSCVNTAECKRPPVFTAFTFDVLQTK